MCVLFAFALAFVFSLSNRRQLDDFTQLNEKFIKARRDYEALLESSMSHPPQPTYHQYAPRPPQMDAGGYAQAPAGYPSQPPAGQPDQRYYTPAPGQAAPGPPGTQQSPPGQVQLGPLPAFSLAALRRRELTPLQTSPSTFHHPHHPTTSNALERHRFSWQAQKSQHKDKDPQLSSTLQETRAQA